MGIDSAKFNARMVKPTRESYESLKECAIYFAIIYKKFQDEPLCLVQLAMAILMDKPIFILAPEGTNISENLRKAATDVQFYTPENFEEVSARMMRKWPDVFGKRKSDGG